MKSSNLLNILLFSTLITNTAYADQTCPKLNGIYSFNFKVPIVRDLASLVKLNLININNGKFEITEDNSKISFLWKNEKNEVINDNLNNEFTFKNYTCKDGWVIFSSKVSSFRNNLPGLYIGESKIRLSIDSLYSGLKVETTFKGKEDLTLFSYDSAHISFLKWWGSKKLVESVVLDTAPNDVKEDIKSQAELTAREIFTREILGSLMLVGIDEKADKIIITLKAFKSSDLKEFEERLKVAKIIYKMKTEPIWTNNSYFLELVITNSSKNVV